MKTMFGQLVIGAPGAGKTSYCRGIKSYYEAIGRPTIILNLDPANEYCEADVNISDLISLEDVMQEFGLGPNGSKNSNI